MHNRQRLLQAATALLYVGPLLAGLAGQGWTMLPLFSAIFVLWSVILRPRLWPSSLADLTRVAALVPLAALIATQTLLVTLCLAIGRGAGGVMGLAPTIPLWLPLAMSFLSVPLSRLVWSPAIAAAHTGFDPLLHRPGPAVALSSEALIQTLLAQIAAMPEDSAETELQAHLTALAAEVDATEIRRALETAATTGPLPRTGRKALIVHATDPDVATLLSGSAYPAEAFLAAGADTALLALFATRCSRAVEDDPDLAADCPSIQAVTEAALKAEPEAHNALFRLAGLLRHSLMHDPEASH